MCSCMADEPTSTNAVHNRSHTFRINMFYIVCRCPYNPSRGRLNTSNPTPFPAARFHSSHILQPFFPIQDINPDAFLETTPAPSFHPNGTKAAATLPTPLSVASKLNCAAAFLVSCISTWIPSKLIALLVAGLSGIIFGPTPRIKRSIMTSAFRHYARP